MVQNDNHAAGILELDDKSMAILEALAAHAASLDPQLRSSLADMMCTLLEGSTAMSTTAPKILMSMISVGKVLTTMCTASRSDVTAAVPQIHGFHFDLLYTPAVKISDNYVMASCAVWFECTPPSPGGLSFDPMTGRLSGTPSGHSLVPFTIKAYVTIFIRRCSSLATPSNMPQAFVSLIVTFARAVNVTAGLWSNPPIAISISPLTSSGTTAVAAHPLGSCCDWCRIPSSVGRWTPG